MSAHPKDGQGAKPQKAIKKGNGANRFLFIAKPSKPRNMVRVFITDLILRHRAEVVETYSQSTENTCVYKEFCNTKGI